MSEDQNDKSQTTSEELALDAYMSAIRGKSWWLRHWFFYRMFRHSGFGVVQSLWMTTR